MERWICMGLQNYDGDVQSDTVAQGFGSLGLMTSTLVTPGMGKQRKPKPPTVPLRDTTANTNKKSHLRPTLLHLSLHGPEGLAHRGKLDDNQALIDFCSTLEQVCIETIESGKMTKDLALLIHEKT